MPRPETRYATALLDAAFNLGIEDAIDGQLREYGRTMKRNVDFKRFMLSPMVSPEVKKDTLIKISDSPPEGLLRDFLFLLVDKNRVDLLPDISLQYWLHKTRRSDILVVHISSPFPLEEDAVKEIGSLFKAKYHAKAVDVRTHKNASLLGGVRVQVRDDLYDGSIRGILEGLRRDIGDSQRGAVDMMKAYQQRTEGDHHNTLIVHVGSATPVSAEQLSRISAGYRDKYGANKVETRTYTDPSLLGGVRVRVHTDVYDGSVQGQLEKILGIPGTNI